MAIKALIIDDEEPARNIIKAYLQDHKDIEIAGEYPDGFSGIKAIQELHPDLIFLDIQMPKLTGFEMLELLDDRPMIIFITAYDQYAIRAFEMNATDYLLKPFSRERFKQSLQKVMRRTKEGRKEMPVVSQVLSSLEEQPDLLQRIAVKSGQKIHVIPVVDIIYIKAEGDYVMIHTGDSRYLKEKTMRYMESHLDPMQFIRIHRSFIVNVNHIGRVEIYDKESYSVLLKSNVSLKASVNGYKLLKQVLKL